MATPDTIEEKEVHRSWLRIVRRRLRHATGGVQEYEIVNPDSHSICTVVLDRNEDVVMVKLYRFGQERRLQELPAGAVDPGESFEAAVRREMLEQTGYAGDLAEVGSHFIAAEHGVTRHVFVSRNCVQVQPPAPEPSEIDEGAVVRVLPIDRFRTHVRSGALTETGDAFMALDWMGLLWH